MKLLAVGKLKVNCLLLKLNHKLRKMFLGQFAIKLEQQTVYL